MTPLFSAGGARFGRGRKKRIGTGTCADHCLATDDAWDKLMFSFSVSVSGEQAVYFPRSNNM